MQQDLRALAMLWLGRSLFWGLVGDTIALPKATAPDMIALAKATVLAVDHLF
jgi:hypothetical protein